MVVEGSVEKEVRVEGAERGDEELVSVWAMEPKGQTEPGDHEAQMGPMVDPEPMEPSRSGKSEAM